MIALARDPLEDHLVYLVASWVGRTNGSHHVARLDLLAIRIICYQVVQVALSVLHHIHVMGLLNPLLVLLHLFLRMQCVVVEEVDKITLVWLEHDLTAEGIDSELLDYLNQVSLFVKFLLGVGVELVFPLSFIPTAEAAHVGAIALSPLASVVLADDVAMTDRLLKLLLLAQLKIIQFIHLV